MMRVIFILLALGIPVLADTEVPDIPDVMVLRDHPEFDIVTPYPEAYRLAAVAHFDPEYFDQFPALSPVTHWVSRVLFLSSERTLTRVAKQTQLSINLANAFTHDEILRLVLQEIYLGQSCFGVRAAVEYRLGADPDAPTLAQALTIMALASAPDLVGHRPDLLLSTYGIMVRDGEAAGLWDAQTADQLLSDGPVPLIPDARCPFD